MSEKTVLHIGDKVVILMTTDINNFEIDADEYMKIDYSNIIGEMLTFPVLMNRIGIIRAEAYNALAYQEFTLNIFRAQLSEDYRKNNVSREKDHTGKRDKIIRPTKDEIENAVLGMSEYQDQYSDYLEAKKNYEIIDSLYWAAKSKDKKLDAMGRSPNVFPEEHEIDIIENTVNGVLIKVRDKKFKTDV